jgi:hypothetical protein
VAVVVHYCDGCGIRIEPDDLADGKAILLEDKAYCPKCAPRFQTAEEEPAEVPKRARPRKPATRPVPFKKKTTTSIMRRPKRVDEYEPDSRAMAPVGPPKKSPLPLVLGICGAAIILIIIIIVASSGGAPDSRRDNARESRLDDRQPDREPDHQPVRQPDRQPVIEPQPMMSKAAELYQSALDYARRNPDDFEGIIDRFDQASRSGPMERALADKIQVTISDWVSRWDAAGQEYWDKTAVSADALMAKGDYEGAAKLWDDFPADKFATLRVRAEKEAARIRSEKAAADALQAVDDDIKAAQKEFTIENIDELRELLDRLLETGRKYQDVQLMIDKLGPVVVRLKEKLGELEEQEQDQWSRDIEELRKKQEAERWAALKAHWQQFYASFDTNAASSLSVGSHSLFDGSSARGWANAVKNDQVTWTAQNGALSGANQNTQSNAVLITHYKQAYFWENYTLSLKARLVAGSCSIAVRTNINEQNQISGAAFALPATGQWVDIRIDVNGDQAVPTIDGQQPGGMNTAYPTGYPAIFLGPGSQVEVKDVSLQLKSIRDR